jgi:transcriptional regulator with XRE-family HTH domain
MVIKGLRQERNWSQEQLADFSGLGLRTIQRIESGSKMSFESLQDLAAVFGMQVDELAQELAMDKTSGEWKKRPLWVRWIFFGSGRIQMDRREFQKLEVIAVFAGAAFIIAGVCGYLGLFFPERTTIPSLLFGSLLLLCANFMSMATRVGDRYSVWPWLESGKEANIGT